MGSTAKMKAGMSQAPKVHIKILLCSSQASYSCEAEEQLEEKVWISSVCQGVVAGFKGSLAKQYNHTNLIKIQGVDDTEDTKFYLGKKIMYMYRAKTEKYGTRFRVMWGKVCRAHGTSGVVRAKFTKNLPPSA